MGVPVRGIDLQIRPAVVVPDLSIEVLLSIVEEVLVQDTAHLPSIVVVKVLE